jgi:hypothetical protein
LLFAFLLESQIVETYWHVEARCKLESFKDNGTEATALLSAVHIYFTNSRNEEAYVFTLRFVRKSGELSIAGAVLEAR